MISCSGGRCFGVFMAPRFTSGGAAGPAGLAAQLVLARRPQAVRVRAQRGLVGLLHAAEHALALAILALGAALLGDGFGPLPRLLAVLRLAHSGPFRALRPGEQCLAHPRCRRSRCRSAPPGASARTAGAW